MPPTRGNGKICYLQIPTTDVARSADFYQRVFGWNIRPRGDGSIAYDPLRAHDGASEKEDSWSEALWFLRSEV